jgi:hypothetical protein
MPTYDDLQATQKRALDLLCNPAAGSHGPGSGTDVSAETMKGVLANALQDGRVSVSLFDMREMSTDGDVGNIVAIGGVLASDTTPVLRGTSGVIELSWAASNNDVVGFQLSLPPDFDGSQDVTFGLRTASGGTTDAASFTLSTSWDSGALVTDTATGNASATYADITATVAAADIPDAPRLLSFQLTPTAHATDAKLLRRVDINYKKKLT